MNKKFYLHILSHSPDPVRSLTKLSSFRSNFDRNVSLSSSTEIIITQNPKL